MLISEEEFNEAFAKLTQDRNKTLADLDKQYQGQAGKLFDDLLGGKGKAFGKSFETDIINIAVAPIKSIFEQTLGGLFGNLSRVVMLRLAALLAELLRADLTLVGFSADLAGCSGWERA